MYKIHILIVILLLDEHISDTAVQVEVIPTSAEFKKNVAMAICRAAKNGNLLFVDVEYLGESLTGCNYNL